MQCERVITIAHPEIAIKSLAQFPCFRFKSGGARLFASATKQGSQLDLCCISVSLHLNQRDGRQGERAVGVYDRVAGIFPPLVSETLFNFTFIFEVTVAIDISISTHPVQCSIDVRAQLMKELQISCPCGMSGYEHEPERRCVNRPKIRCVRHLA